MNEYHQAGVYSVTFPLQIRIISDLDGIFEVGVMDFSK